MSLLDSYATHLGSYVPRHRAELALTIAKEEAVKANQAKSDFLANMSHELRTPLNAILGFSDVIRTYSGDRLQPDRVREYASDIYTSGIHLLSLIDEVLDLAKIEAGKLELSKHPVNLETLASDVCRMVRENAVNAEINLEPLIEEGLPFLLADEMRLKQVLLNLLSNAIKFTPPQGRVHLWIHFNENKDLVLEVQDTGVGMYPEDIPRALAPFQQIEEALVKKHEGTGLGLPLAKAFTELMEGTMFILSTVNVGTTIKLIFPQSLLEQDTDN